MGFLELFMIAIGLSMDAFAVSLGKGLGMSRLSYRRVVIIAAFFGGFQAAMPLFGWLLGRQFEQYITSVDHWIAFALLSFIGVKMLREAGRDGNECLAYEERLQLRELFVLAVATSIDALAVGITFAFLKVSILPSVALIGVTTFALSAAGAVVGYRFGAKFKNKAEMAGGVILILIGIKILLEHLGIL